MKHLVTLPNRELTISQAELMALAEAHDLPESLEQLTHASQPYRDADGTIRTGRFYGADLSPARRSVIPLGAFNGVIWALVFELAVVLAVIASVWIWRHIP